MQRLAAVNSKTASGDICAQSVKARLCLSLTRRTVAKVCPPEQENDSQATFADVLKKLEAEGKIRLPKRPLRKFRAVPSRAKPASQMIIEDRR